MNKLLGVHCFHNLVAWGIVVSGRYKWREDSPRSLFISSCFPFNYPSLPLDSTLTSFNSLLVISFYPSYRSLLHISLASSAKSNMHVSLNTLFLPSSLASNSLTPTNFQCQVPEENFQPHCCNSASASYGKGGDEPWAGTNCVFLLRSPPITFSRHFHLLHSHAPLGPMS